ncbi:MAG: hydroxyacid dehydrogenase [Streptosporangiales bacterium]|nr:hydroxyacid dehydrogenase [Streptosporangiales bacterium]
MTDPAETAGTAGTVLVTSRSFGTGRVDVAGHLDAAGLRPVRGSVVHDLAELRPLLADAVGWIAGTAAVTGEHLDAAPRLRVVARYGVGVDAVDVAAASRRGVVVTNTPAANTTAVADLTLALALAVLRNVVEASGAVRAGDWSVRRGRELGALTVGLVGLGRIGLAVAARLRGFGCTVVGHDPYADADVGRTVGVEPVALRDLLMTADLVSLHCPGGTVRIDDGALARVRPGAVLVNTARADLVDETAVARALRDGRLGGYGADMVAGEAGSDSPVLAPDLADRVVVTPHLGAQTVDAVDRMGAGAVRAVVDVLAGRTPESAVVSTGAVR